MSGSAPAIAAVEAERAILGAVLVSPDVLATVGLKPNDFTVPSHRSLWAALARLDEEGRPLDLVTVGSDLEARGELQAAGGRAYIASLLDGVPRHSSVDSWEAIVRDRSQRRAIVTAAERMQALARGESPAADALEEGARILHETAIAIGSSIDFNPARQIKEAVRSLEISGQGTAAGWTTGLPSLDWKVGALLPGQLVIVAARTGLGKSTLLANIGDAIAAQGGPVLMFSAEMTELEVNRRRLCAAANVPSARFQVGGPAPTEREWERVVQAADVLLGRPFYVDSSAPTPIEARAKARLVKVRKGLAAVLVDYLQLMPAGTGRRGETRENEVARVSRALKRLAMDLGVVVVAAAQLNRSGDQRKDGRPRLSDLRESGSQEQDADIVLLLHQDEGHDDETEVVVAKHRNKPRATTRLRFHGATHRFAELGDEGAA